MNRLDRTDLLAGLFVIAMGLYFAIGGLEYRMGTVVRMGPGFVPVSLGVLAVILGAGICLAAFRRAGALPEIDLRQTLFVLGTIVVFALLLERLGLIPAAFLSVLTASAALPVTRPVSNLVLAVCVAVGTWAVFVLILGLPIPAFRFAF
ncbi:hypothetical protein ATO6_16435 [Oceanicola sp. 22II-s10i]|uniref:tripartite tricarboxylate transporter TctB family protein n=1 Tax=Oceanicola sp. 22II-s10i TaxID=1317116 RepID=UPI000B520F85|nr:tripartite tricarboxylate transporter TctB family protein [Oceanicola sp. 22II-s10i]OWU83987.1 hypothetical protein ATO6_16435 [Oceanicola sp. 22II-s10i]